MVSSLKFKGETRNKKKRKHDSDKLKVNLDQDNAEGWVSANKTEDLKGPVVIAMEIGDVIACISANSEGVISISTNIDILQDAQDILNTVEPNSTEQVFVLTPLSLGQRNENAIDFAFKTSSGTYLTVENDGKISSDAAAIGSTEKFQLKLTDKRWIIKTDSGAPLCIINGKIFAISDDKLESTRFTLRIQAQNKYKPPETSSLLNMNKISTKELESRTGRKLTDDEVRRLKQAYRNGKLNETLIDMNQKWKTDARC